MKPKSTINEKYWAVRVGDPRRHTCYLWIRDNATMLPALFQKRAEAEEIASTFTDGSTAKAVRVVIRCG